MPVIRQRFRPRLSQAAACASWVAAIASSGRLNSYAKLNATPGAAVGEISGGELTSLAWVP